jgi:hypothetical protein
MPDAIQSVLNNNVTRPELIFHKEKIKFIQTTRHWHNADKLAVGLRDIRTSITNEKHSAVNFRMFDFRTLQILTPNPDSVRRNGLPDTADEQTFRATAVSLCVSQANT